MKCPNCGKTIIQKVQVSLSDAVPDLDDAKFADIPVALEYAEQGQFGIIVDTEGGEGRVVVENYRGKLIVYLWATIDSLGGDPTHKIELERDPHVCPACKRPVAICACVRVD